MFATIEKLKQQYTDQFVVVDGSRPELARFDGYTGQVKTVNMSGRALVQFDAWNNIAWYDIDTSALTIVPKPEPGAEGKSAKAAPAKAAVNKKEDVIGEKPTGGAPGAKPGGKMSTAEILAAARAKAAGGAAAASAPAKPAAKPAVAAKPAAAAAKPAAAAPGKKLSTAEILAMARANKAGDAPAPASQPVAEADTAEPAAESAPIASSATSGEGAHYSGPIPTTTAERIALCRQLDSK